jgi:hypothetical protein
MVSVFFRVFDVVRVDCAECSPAFGWRALCVFGGSMEGFDVPDVTDLRGVLIDMGNTVLDYHRGERSDDEKDRAGLVLMQGMLASDGVSLEHLERAFFARWTEQMRDRAQRSGPLPTEFAPHGIAAAPTQPGPLTAAW